MDFSETVAASDLKVGRCRQLIEFMKLCEYRRSGSFLYHIFSRFCIFCVGLGTAYRNRTAVYRGTLLHTAVRTTVYRNSIKLTVIVNLSTAMGIHLIDMPTSHGV